MKNMFKNITMILIGVVIGGIFFSTLPIKAAIEEFICYKIDYPIYVNGKLIESEDTPPVTYGGTTYIPLRLFCEILDIPIGWDGKTKRVDLKSKQTESIIYENVIIDEKECTKINEVLYIQPKNITKNITDKYRMPYDNETKILRFCSFELQTRKLTDLITTVPYYQPVPLSSIYIEYKYYIENIKPLIK